MCLFEDVLTASLLFIVLSVESKSVDSRTKLGLFTLAIFLDIALNCFR